MPSEPVVALPLCLRPFRFSIDGDGAAPVDNAISTISSSLASVLFKSLVGIEELLLEVLLLVSLCGFRIT